MELCKFGIAASIKAFRDVVHRRSCRSLDLILQTKIAAEFVRSGRTVNNACYSRASCQLSMSSNRSIAMGLCWVPGAWFEVSRCFHRQIDFLRQLHPIFPNVQIFESSNHPSPVTRHPIPVTQRLRR